jgi:hypothetical protein
MLDAVEAWLLRQPSLLMPRKRNPGYPHGRRYYPQCAPAEVHRPGGKVSTFTPRECPARC